MDFQKFIIDPNNATNILFGASGRLGPMEFAQGLVAIVAISLVFNILSLIPGLGMLISLVGFLVALVLAFAWVCIFSKRFHDAGKSGWLTLVAILAAIVIGFVAGLILNPVFGVPAVDPANPWAALSVIGPMIVIKNMLTTIIINGALGFYMYRLPTVASAAPAQPAPPPSNDGPPPTVGT